MERLAAVRNAQEGQVFEEEERHRLVWKRVKARRVSGKSFGGDDYWGYQTCAEVSDLTCSTSHWPLLTRHKLVWVLSNM